MTGGFSLFMAGSVLFLKPPSHLILCAMPADVIHSHPTAGARAKRGAGHGSAAEQGRAGGLVCIENCYFDFLPVAGNSCKQKPGADASSRIPALTVEKAVGKGSRNPGGSMGPQQLGRSYCSESFPGASGAVNP